MIIGHKTQWQFLKKIIENDRIPQAMIFTGIDSLGKKKVALEFIKFLNCQRESHTQLPSLKTCVSSSQGIFTKNKDLKGEPCQSCLSCKLIEKGQHPDLILITPEKNEIQISQIRELQKALNLKPRLSDFKLVIIDDAQCLNSQSQNCLLKTLEEPKGNSLLILITSNLESLFETIRSRCQILKFYPVSLQELEENFKTQVPLAQLQKIFLVSQGKPGRFLDFLKNSQKFLEEFKIFEEIEKLLESDLPEKFSFSREFFKKETSQVHLNYFLDTIRNYIIIVLE